MELIQLLKGRWLAIAIAAPLAAGVLAAVVFAATAEPRYSAHATATVTDAFLAPDEPGDPGSFSDDFSAVLDSGLVRTAAADAADVPVAAVADRFSHTQVGDRTVELAWSGATPREGRVGVEAAMRAALETVAQDVRRRASLEVDAANTTLADAQQRQEEIEREANTRDIETEYRTRTTDLLNLRNTLASSTATPALNEILRQKTAEREALGEVLAQWQQARADVEAASTDLASASGRLTRADRNVAYLADGQVVQSLDVTQQSAFGDIARAAVAAMIAAVIAVVLAALVVSRQRGLSGGMQAEPKPEPPAVAPKRASAGSGRTTGNGGGAPNSRRRRTPQQRAPQLDNT
jgi:hypothetical protein